MRRALICEDDPSIRKLVATVVRREGFEVDVAEEGAAGMKKMTDGCYDLLVLDLMMPGVDGYAVVDFLKSHHPERLKRVIVMTAVTDALRDEFPAPVCTVMAKPFDVDALREAIRSCAVSCDGSGSKAAAS